MAKLRNFFKPTTGKVIVSVIIILIIEAILFWIGLFFVPCEECPPDVEYCPLCISFDLAIKFVIATIIPAVAIVYFLVCLFSAIFRAIFKKRETGNEFNNY
jgi:hypothetical protein